MDYSKIENIYDYVFVDENIGIEGLELNIRCPFTPDYIVLKNNYYCIDPINDEIYALNGNFLGDSGTICVIGSQISNQQELIFLNNSKKSFYGNYDIKVENSAGDMAALPGKLTFMLQFIKLKTNKS